MAEQMLNALSMLTEFFAVEHIEASARRTGFVKRASKITGKIFLALVTFGVWSDAKTTLAQLAAKVTHVDEHIEVSPEAIYQRMNQRAIAFLQDMIGKVFDPIRSIDNVCDDGLFASFLKVYVVDSTGLDCQNVSKRFFPAPEGVLRKLGQKFNWPGTIKAVRLDIWR
jgi:hypothetical protein